MYKYKVYLFIFPNGKKYCGYTSQENINNRWHGGTGYKKCPLVWRAIQKYGWENIIKTIIYSSPIMEEALNKEKEIIALYNLTNPKFGYNLDKGGKPQGASAHLTPEGRKKISENTKKMWQNPEHREKVSKILKALPHPPLSEETKKKISKTKWGSIPPNRKAVIQLDKNTNQILNNYVSATAAALALGIDKTGCSNILNACKGKRNTAYGYKWRFKE